ncbi:MAG: folate family ECF transporter S component [Clostridia bacterium]|nr:folate family ECF transporter S component [Clostridia bacterium]
MQKTKNGAHPQRAFENARALAMSAVLVAMSIVCGKFLAFNLGSFLRVSFENLPILLGGMIFGPVWGAVIGVTADLIGCLMVGYAINPLVMLGAALIGAMGGLIWWLANRFSGGVRVALTVALSHLVGSVVVKSFGLAVFYDMPMGVLMLWRSFNYVIVGAAECLLLLLLIKNKAVASMMRRFGNGKEEKP